MDVRSRLLEQVRSGRFEAGQALPKEQDLAVSLQVARSTVRRALAGLEADGMIRRIRGKGTFVNTPQERREHLKIDVFSLIVPYLREDPLPGLIEGFEQVATRLEHQTAIASSNNDVSQQERLLRQAAERNVAGVAIVPSTRLPSPDHIRLLQDRHIPVVFCSRSVDDVRAPLVTWPRTDVGRVVAEALLDQGHRRIVSLADFGDIFVEAVGAGIRQKLREHDVDGANYQLRCFGEGLSGQKARDAIRSTLEELLSGRDRPTAIQCFNSFDAEQVYLLAGELGITIPGDLSLIYFGAKRRKGALAQRFTCVGVDEREVGIQAAKLLDDMSSGRMTHDSNLKIEVPLTLLPGETVTVPPQNGST